jgi:acetylornithine deacetylase/succinyl-diaminopimelate desuccinylase-like protein
VYARGAADDKGNFLPLLLAACDLARAGELPVNVRVLVEGEEEVGSKQVLEWIAADERGADCAIVFDSVMADERTPALSVASRGMVGAKLTVRAGERDVHSGLYGGATLNAVHALAQVLSAVMPGPDGRVRDELRAGVELPGKEEVESWSRLPLGDQALAEVGARPVSPDAAREFHLRTGAEPALDVHGLAAGSGHELRTIVPAVAQAALSLRIVAGQRAQEMADALEGLLRDALPAGADLEVGWSLAEPAAFDPGSPPLRLAREALGRSCGVEPVPLRLGGTLPLLSALAERDIPAIVTGFVVPGDAYHAPNESFRLAALELGERAARELYAALAALP